MGGLAFIDVRALSVSIRSHVLPGRTRLVSPAFANSIINLPDLIINKVSICR